MSEEKVITLKPERKIFEDIYFSGNQGSLFFHQLLKEKRLQPLQQLLFC
jgi:hypothetical protein